MKRLFPTSPETCVETRDTASRRRFIQSTAAGVLAVASLPVAGTVRDQPIAAGARERDETADRAPDGERAAADSALDRFGSEFGRIRNVRAATRD